MIRLARLTIPVALLSGTASAALPPQYQRPKEIRAILDDSAVMKAFGPTHPIDKIERVELAHYRVTSGACFMEVMLIGDPAITHPPNWVGPWAFVVRAGALTCPSP